MKCLYNEYFKPLKKNIGKKGTRKCEDVLCSWLGRIDIVKMTIQKLFIGSMQSQPKFQFML